MHISWTSRRLHLLSSWALWRMVLPRSGMISSCKTFHMERMLLNCQGLLRMKFRMNKLSCMNACLQPKRQGLQTVRQSSLFQCICVCFLYLSVVWFGMFSVCLLVCLIGIFLCLIGLFVCLFVRPCFIFSIAHVFCFTAQTNTPSMLHLFV